MFDDFVRVYKKYSKSSFYQQLELELAVKAFVTETVTDENTGEITDYIDFEQMKLFLLNEGECLYKQDLAALENKILEKCSNKTLVLDQKSGKYIQKSKISVQDVCNVLLQHLSVDSVQNPKKKIGKIKPKKNVIKLKKV